MQEMCERVDSKQIGSLLQEVPDGESIMRIAAGAVDVERMSPKKARKLKRQTRKIKSH
jgi:hypothetical protein